jgi:hypothetical protein
VELLLTHPDQSALKKRSRYSALATINRQLEAGMHSKSMLEHVTARNQVLEQDLRIERGKALLSARNEQTETEMKALRIQSKNMERELNEMREENERLRSDAEKYLKKIKDLEAWKLRMKAMIDGDSEE